VGSSFRFSDNNFVCISYLPHGCYMPPITSSFVVMITCNINFDG
jgi:hypothetical protein